MDGMASSSSGPARETDRTAELDNRGLLQMQEQVMKEQDKNLEELERYVQSSKVRMISSNPPDHNIQYAHLLCFGGPRSAVVLWSESDVSGCKKLRYWIGSALSSA